MNVKANAIVQATENKNLNLLLANRSLIHQRSISDIDFSKPLISREGIGIMLICLYLWCVKGVEF